jgi:ribosomal protein S18 acetylase RimI-like enzyme
MSHLVAALSSRALVPALETNMYEFFMAWGRTSRGELYQGTDLIQVITGLPVALLNGISGAQLTPETADAAIEASVARVTSYKVPAYWFIGPSTRPLELGTYLERQGFVPSFGLPGMAADLLVLKEGRPPPTDLTIERVRDLETLATWARTAWTGTGFPVEGREAFVELETSIGVEPDTSRLRYLGFQRGVPVAASAMILQHGVAGIYAVATLPEARRQGVGTALTLTPLRDARAMGYRVGTLQASSMGYSVYRCLGFQQVCEFSVYLCMGDAGPDVEKQVINRGSR